MYTRNTMTPKEVAIPALGPGTQWDIMRDRANRNRGFLKYVWNLEAKEVPDLVDFNPGDIYKHPAILNYIRLNQGQDVKFKVAELNPNTDAKARKYMQNQLKVSRV